MTGPKNPHCDAIHSEKYREEGESFLQMISRNVGALADNSAHYDQAYPILAEQRFMPPGRVQTGAGSKKQVTLFNCFVMPTIHDSFTDGPSHVELEALTMYDHPPLSIMDTAVSAAKTMRKGGGVGYDISTLRPAGDFIAGVQAHTDGPLAFAPIYDGVCRATSSAGNRRGAQMLVMRVDHPDIRAFIKAKQVADKNIPYDMRPLRGFNMSVAITDEFMHCKDNGLPFDLRFDGKVYATIDALELWTEIMLANYDWAEPGVLFIDRINKMNNLWYCETIAATNPCGEQPLPPYGACLLGSFNLVKYIRTVSGSNAWEFDYEAFKADIPIIVRLMDNVIDVSIYPLTEQEKEAKAKRRIGLGVTGLANALEAMGLPYGDNDFLEEQSKIFHILTNEAYRASAYLAKEKGAFPYFNKEKYLQGEFIKTLDQDVVELIAQYGIRNSHLTSIAPTGTISLTADNVSSGVEPVYDYMQMRSVITMAGKMVVEIPDYGVEYFGVKGRTVAANEITAEQHIRVLATAQKYMDAAVSKTVNVPSNFSLEEFMKLYDLAYSLGAKGCTTYRPAGNYDEPIKSAEVKPEEQIACGWDPVTGQRTGSCAEN